MQVQSIQLYTMPKSLRLRDCDLQSVNCDEVNSGVDVSNDIRSIYSKGMTSVAFGNSGKVLTCFEKEIAEQPDVLGRLIRKYFVQPHRIDMNLNINKEEAKNLRKIHIFASGSSKNASEMAQGFMEKMTGIPVFVHSASEAMDNMKPLNPKEDLAIFVSQSGGTADTYATLEMAKKAGLKTFAITNNPDSKIAKAVDSHISLEAGEEKAVAATKTVTSSILSLMLIGLNLGQTRETLSKTDIDNMHGYFNKLPSAIGYMLQRDYDVKKAADIISKADNIYYYAKGNNVGSAKEGALKLTETTGKRVIADASGEALHGTFASIKPEDVVLQIVGLDNEKIALQNAEEIFRKRHVKNPILMMPLGTARNFHYEGGIDPVYVEYPHVYGDYDAVTPIMATIKFQQITNEVTKKLGIDPDNGGGFLTKFRQNISM